MTYLDETVKEHLAKRLDSIEEQMESDLMSIYSPILPGLDLVVQRAIEMKKKRKPRLAVMLETNGGVVEVVERIVNTIRYHYGETAFIVPNIALSAGTVLVMSGDRILMDYFSCLGPIDPQIEKDGKLVSALSYLAQYERLVAKSEKQALTTAEYALLSKLDLGELHQYQQARELSVELLQKWLTTYKFRYWTVTETQKRKVTPEMKEDRAKRIALLLSDNERWHSHGRGISMKVLRDEISLKIEDLADKPALRTAVREYFELLKDYIISRELFRGCVHTKEYF